MLTIGLTSSQFTAQFASELSTWPHFTVYISVITSLLLLCISVCLTSLLFIWITASLATSPCRPLRVAVAGILHAGCPSYCPTNSVKTLKETCTLCANRWNTCENCHRYLVFSSLQMIKHHLLIFVYTV